MCSLRFMLFLWIYSILLQTTHQIYDANCLRANPRLLDTTLSFFPDVGNLVTTPEAIAHQFSLVSKRFKRVHNIHRDHRGMSILDGLSHFAKTSNKTAPWFLSPPYDLPTWSMNEAVSVYEDLYKTVKGINSAHENPLIVGLYLPPTYLFSPTHSPRMQLDAVESVFGSKETSRLPLGYLLVDCFLDVQNPHHLEHFQRLQLITCPLNDKLFWNASEINLPQEHANEVIKRCDQLRDNATSLKLTAEVLCLASFPSQEKTKNGIVGSDEGFQIFWCRIVHQLAHNKSHAGIVMESAFDNIYELYGMSEPSGEYNTGWWRRLNLHGERGDYVEKVEELVGGREFGKCRDVCHICNISEDCCPRRKCEVDYAFQFLAIPKSRPRTCQTPSLLCNPSIVPPNPRPEDRTSTRTPAKRSIPPTFRSITTGPANESPAITDVFIILICTIAGVLLTGVISYFIHRSLKNNKVLTRKDLSLFFDGCSSLTGGLVELPFSALENFEHFPYNQDLEIEDSEFEIYEDTILGCGSFGIIFKGRMGDKDVAVKTMLHKIENKVYLKALLLEIKVLSYLGHHENIVNLLGAHTSELNSGKLLLFLELCPLGNLLEFLRSQRSYFMNYYKEKNSAIRIPRECDERESRFKDLLRWSLQISNAMRHLAGKGVIHGDIAARNILVFSTDQVKLADFGLSRRLYECSNYVKSNQEPLPWRHMAIEALRELSFSLKSDVWAFGITMWEMFSLGEVPYPGLTWTQQYVNLLIGGLRPPRPQCAHPLLYEVMIYCWTTYIQSRPDIELVHSKLTYTLNELFTDKNYVNPLDL